MCPVLGTRYPVLLSRRLSYRFSGLIDDIVYDSVFLCLLRVHDKVPLHVLFSTLSSFCPLCFESNWFCNLAHTQDFAGMDVDIGSLTR